MLRPRCLALVLTAACATVPAAPEWFADGTSCDRAMPDGGRRVCASAAAPTPEEARSAALATALGRAAKQIEVTVQQRLEVDVSCLTVDGAGKSDSECRERAAEKTSASTRRLSFRNVATEKFKVSRDGDGHRAWVVVRIPPDEWTRLRRAAAGRTLVAVDCRLGTGACPAVILDQLTTVLASCGLAKAGGFVTDAESAEHAVRRAVEADAGRALLVSLRAEAAPSDGDLALSSVQGRWELFDTHDGRTLAARGLPTRPVPGRSPETAMQGALRASIERLAATSCGMSDARGSLCCVDLETGNARE
ncbi:MAG: hypothetical protein RL199_93 [Pseudomonadota bacterium]